METIRPILESVAKVLIINRFNEVLILTVGEYKERPDKSFKPDLPGGIVESGENEQAGAIREAQEETGIKLDPESTRLLYTETKFYSEENKSVSKFLYVSYVDSTPQVTISWEHASFAWVPLKDLLGKVELRPFCADAVEYCFNNRLL